MRVAIIQTPGSNCDQDAYYALNDDLHVKADYVWFTAKSLEGYDAVLLPGGFTYGDYLRGGALAALAPVIEEVKRFAEEGKPVIGICNGFQILTEAHILPGALVRNASRRFLCKEVYIKPVNKNSFWTEGIEEIIKLPIAHNEGRYVADEETISKLEREGRVAFVYCNEQGEITEEANPNGSTHAIAGILNEKGNVLGIMPHPERACNYLLGSEGGKKILEKLAR